MTIVVATTLHGYVTDQVDTSQAWLYNAEAIAQSHDDGVRFFAALETDGRGIAPFDPLLTRMYGLADGLPVDRDLHQIGVDHWTFSFDDGATEITTGNRLRRITLGQNLASQYATEVGATHLLFCAADCAPPPDVLPKLLEMDHPLVGPEIPTYCLSGHQPMRWETCSLCNGSQHLPDGRRCGTQPGPGGCFEGGAAGKAIMQEHPGQVCTGPLYPDFPVQEHMASAACILIAREVFTRLRWRTDPERNMTDDPCYHADAREILGVQTFVRKDVQARHYPESICAIEGRGHDRMIYR